MNLVSRVPYLKLFSSCASALKRRVICRPTCGDKLVLIGLLLEFSVPDNIKCLLNIMLFSPLKMLSP